MKDSKGQEVCTTDGRPGEEADIATIVEDGPRAGQQKDYRVLCTTEREKGFVRPFRNSYRHLKCGTVTTMGRALSETYARDPSFYSGTFCAGCGDHFPVGANGEFVWTADGEKVGT